MNDVISAISTAAGTGGVAIIRLSGEGALGIAEKMFNPSGKISVAQFVPNMMYPGTISGDGFTDYGLCVYFKSPKSFTGEDVVEFHCHGGVQISRGILAKTLSCGARAAENGEFTRRAFLNGKLSLSSAEGMIDMINAESLASLRAGSMLYNEKLNVKIREIQDELTSVLAEIAADCDYPEEDLEGLNPQKITENIKIISRNLNELADSYSEGKKIKEGVTVAICGKPNTGKSSILNRLLGYEKAIVSDKAGTTRDAVEGALQINGVNFNFFDTAGIRERAGAVEAVGIERARKIISTADIVLSVSDGGGQVDIDEVGGKIIRVFNKCDLSPAPEGYDIAVSAKMGEGFETLKKALYDSSFGELSLDKAYIIEKRHYTALTSAKAALDSAVANAASFTPDILAIDLKEAWDFLGEITGETANEDIINTVFAKFCVGK